MALEVIAPLDREGRQLDAKMAFLEVGITKDLYVELLDGVRDSPNQI